MDHLEFLQILWFVLIGVLWVGYFILEGFDFGVGMLLRVLGRDRAEKRMIIHTIGPVWDGNEVWLLTAGGATFAAFPGWYASLFSGFYLALFLILAALIVRGVSFEFWGKQDGKRWRASWEWAAAGGSFLAALLWGVGWANIVKGVPMNARHDVTASLLSLLHPYALLGGLTTLSLFVGHGAIFLALRTRGEIVERSRALALRVSATSAALMLGFLLWTALEQSGGGVKVSAQILAGAGVALAAAVPLLVSRARDGWAFALSAGAIALLFASLFTDLFPNALPASVHAHDLTLAAASSSHYTLTVMSVVAAIFVPIVLLYQGWTYWVFRHRLGRDEFEGPLTPVAVLSSIGGGGGDGRPQGGAPVPQAPSGTGAVATAASGPGAGRAAASAPAAGPAAASAPAAGPAATHSSAAARRWPRASLSGLSRPRSPRPPTPSPDLGRPLERRPTPRNRPAAG